MKKLQIALVAAVAILAGALGFRLGSESAIQTLYVPALVFEKQRPLIIPSARELGSLENVVAYFDEHRAIIASELSVSHETRLKATYAMYVTHISAPYGSNNDEPSFQTLITSDRAHCGIYSMAQFEINQAFGLESRIVDIDGGWHGLVEVRIDGEWEIFDSTVNVWVNTSVESLLDGEPRQYRASYTPIADPNRPDARYHLNEGWNVPELRATLVYWGLGIPSPSHVQYGHLITEELVLSD